MLRNFNNMYQNFLYIKLALNPEKNSIVGAYVCPFC